MFDCHLTVGDRFATAASCAGLTTTEMEFSQWPALGRLTFCVGAQLFDACWIGLLLIEDCGDV